MSGLVVTLWHHCTGYVVEHSTINQCWRRCRRHHTMWPDKARLHSILCTAILGQSNWRNHSVRRHLLHLAHCAFFFCVGQLDDDWGRCALRISVFSKRKTKNLVSFYFVIFTSFFIYPSTKSVWPNRFVWGWVYLNVSWIFHESLLLKQKKGFSIVTFFMNYVSSNYVTHTHTYGYLFI